MSIRVKILMILVLGMLVALTVSTLSFLNAQRLDRAIDRILTQDMAALRAVSEAREALRDARRTENLMIAWRDASLKGDLDRSIASLAASIDSGQAVAPDVETSDIYQAIRTRTQAYTAAIEKLVKLLREGEGKVGERQDAMLAEIGKLREALRKLQDALGDELAPDADEKPSPLPRLLGNGALDADERAHVNDLVTQIQSSLDRLADVEPRVSDFESASAEQLEERIARRLEVTDEKLRALIEALDHTEHASRVDGLDATLVALDREARGLSEAAGALVDGILELRGESRTLQGDIESDFATLTKASWQAVEHRREEIGDQRSLAISLIITILVGGVALVVLLGVVLMRGMTRNFDELLRAAEEIQQGNLDTRVRIPGRDELQRLGSAFNAMAKFLSDRRKQQIDYNDIVTLLNSTLSTEEILAGSLHEIVIRSGSDVGAFYAADESGQELRLARGFGLSHEMTQRERYRLGAGLVGQAAKNRRKILVSPVPEGAFDIDVGLGRLRPQAVLILPVVHVDALLGVFVLVSAQQYPDEALTFIEEVVFQFGVAYNNARFVATIEATAMALRERTEELIRQRARLENVNRELENANRLKSDFLANVTHELRTPLNSIIGFSELVLDRPELGDKPRRHLETVLRNARNLLGLINDLLDITKIESGKVTLHLGPVDIAALVEDCLQTVSPLVDRERVALESRIEPGLDTVHSDRGKLHQVLINLLSNAAKFTEEGAIRVDVRGVVRDGGESGVEFSVLDTGIGIHSEDLPFIFDKFRQVDGSSSRKYGGTGLGLTITSELVHVLGGQITARSEPGAGSTFVVVVPRELDLARARALAASAEDARHGDASSSAAGLAGDTAGEGSVPHSMASLPVIPRVADRHSLTTPGVADAAAAAARSAPGRRRISTGTDVLPAIKSEAMLRRQDDAATTIGLERAGGERSLAAAGESNASTVDADADTQVEGSSASTRGPLVVIDDEPVSVIRLREGLINDGFEIKSAFVCSDALALVRSFVPTAVILGRPLPEKDGQARLEELATRLRELAVPVLLLGSGAHPALELGLSCLGQLERPIDPEAVLAILEATPHRP